MYTKRMSPLIESEFGEKFYIPESLWIEMKKLRIVPFTAEFFALNIKMGEQAKLQKENLEDRDELAD